MASIFTVFVIQLVNLLLLNLPMTILLQVVKNKTVKPPFSRSVFCGTHHKPYERQTEGFFRKLELAKPVVRVRRPCDVSETGSGGRSFCGALARP